jgi:CheY-like chemotaxis protein
MRILVVEDDPHSRAALVALLRIRGFGVVEAANGAEALEKLHAAAPDLLLCDWTAGFYVVDCESEERVIEIAAVIPDAESNDVEIWPVLDMSQWDW